LFATLESKRALWKSGGGVGERRKEKGRGEGEIGMNVSEVGRNWSDQCHFEKQKQK
jgi:hypothetical protein